jgi:hypothetical protein
MDNWNYNIKEVPKSYLEEYTSVDSKGKTVVRQKVVELFVHLLLKGIVYSTTWLPKEERWNGWCKGQEPEAFIPFPKAPKKE